MVGRIEKQPIVLRTEMMSVMGIYRRIEAIAQK